MNQRQTYEQLIADKLKKLPSPDANASWQQMKRLLDDDEDTRVGGKRPPGNKGGWWRIGIIALLLTTSLWLYIEKTNQPVAALAKNNIAAGNNAAETKNNSIQHTTNSANNKKSTIDNTTTPSVSTSNTNTGENKEINNPAGIDNAGSASITKNNTPAVNNTVMAHVGGKNLSAHTINKPVENTTAKTANTENTAIAANDNTYKKSTNSSNKNNIINTRSTAGNFAAGGNSSKEIKRTIAPKTNDIDIAENEKSSTAITAAAPFTQKNKGRLYTGKGKNNPGRNSNNNLQDDDKTSIAADNNSNGGNLANSGYTPVNQPASAKENNWFERLNEIKIPGTIPSFNTSLAAADNMEGRGTVNNLINIENKKLAARVQREKATEELAKKEKKSLHLNLSNVFKPFSLHIDDEPRWAAGIALNSGITVNAQSRYNYNMNAKSGTLTDYIPSPYLQFHLNNAVYMQTELNFITPQYTPQLLVYQQNTQLAQTGMSQEKSIYIQKLYYFNLPLSLHYSPINNLYLAGGIQFSSFQSGLVSIQEKQYDTQSGPASFNSITNSVIKFKDDSIAAKLAPNEWRWQTGADYYWNRFTLGMRYNKSFKDLLNVNVSSSLPLTTTRNASFILFMRYNLFESKKKDNSEQQRSLTRY